MRFLTIAIAAYRSFGTRTTGGSTKGRPTHRYKNKVRAESSDFRKPKTRVNWTDEHKKIISAVSEKKSVFITGSAGTGKTIFVKHLITLLRRLYGPSRVFVTAPTGVAACAIRGQTLHSFAGIGFSLLDRESLLESVLADSKTLKRWLKVEALIIDEISMVGAELFESLEYIARMTREKDTVWGGIQLIVSGDFFQLPPINKQSVYGKEFAFEADCWNSSFDLQVELTKVFRQSDSRLIEVLQCIRRGETDLKSLDFLEQSCTAKEPDPMAIQLYPLNEDVRKVNSRIMDNLQKEIVTYTAMDSGVYHWKKQLKQGIAPDEIALCEGARVMLIRNLNTWCGLVNGATGTVVSFYEPKKEDMTDICQQGLLPIVEFDSGHRLRVKPEKWTVIEGNSVVATRKQVPLILAWALSIHKSQGMSLDKLHTDLSRAFNYGMVYVALSRARSLEGLKLSNFRPSVIKAHPKVLEFYNKNLLV